MSIKSEVVAATVVGAVVGALAGYVFFTRSGRSLSRQLGPAFRDLGRELNDFRGVIAEAAGVASGGWNLLMDLIGDAQSRMPHHSPTEQSRPF